MEILPCPMCGSPAELRATGVLEVDYDWQVLWIKCTKEKNEHCGMELCLNADFWYLADSGSRSEEKLIKCWNDLSRKPEATT